MMQRAGRKAAVMIAAAVPLLLIAGCTGPTDSGEPDESGQGKSGGTLKLAGNADVLHLDPSSAYSPPDYQIHRVLTRTLLAHVPAQGEAGGSEIVPDLALSIPTIENGGVSEDGLTYTIELQEGVEFDAPSGAREIVAQDVVLAAKRICNPVEPSAVATYFTATIEGLAEYCEGFETVAADVDSIREYIEGNDIAGVTAPDDHTVQFTLTQPATDFISILALGVFMAPQPVEYLDYLPDSPEMRQNFISSGPYRIAEYEPGISWSLERNPVWDGELDPVREAYVDSIEIAMGQDAAAVQQQLEAGTVDMQWSDTLTPTASVPALMASNDERLVIGADGGIKPYIVINTLSPNADGAFADPLVRQALNFAVNRAAIQQILGGPGLAEVATQIMPPEVLGEGMANVLDVPEEGDQEKAKQMLTDAGYTDPVPVRLLYRETEPYASIATIMQQDLNNSGFDVELAVTTQNAFYGEYLQNEDATRGGEWDIAPAAWGADYLDGRAYLVPMLDGRTYGGGSPNFGGWNNEEFNSAVDAALAATDIEEANEHWANADAIATEDAAWVPVAFTRSPVFHSSRVGGFEYLAWTRNGDMANVWIE